LSTAYVIEIASLTAGLAVREAHGFRFYCADAAFRPLDARHFRGLRALRAAVDRLAAGLEREAPPHKHFTHDRRLPQRRA
jgi:hypothetical protein